MTDDRKNEIWANVSQEDKAHIKGMADGELPIVLGVDEILVEWYTDYRAHYEDVKSASREDTYFPDRESQINDKRLHLGDIDYTQYRLELVKGLARAMIGNFNDDVVECSVEYADEIIKRLKETKE